MKDLVLNFASQLHESLIIGESHHFIADTTKDIRNIVLTGLGGSGIGGSIVQNYVFDKCPIPFNVNKDYYLPSYINQHSLVIISSYSGNTEETTAAMQQAIKAKANIVCISSGGKVTEIAKKKNFDCILLPAGMPPRSCIGYSMIQVLFILRHYGFIKGDFVKEIKAVIKTLNTEEKNIQKTAKNIAQKLLGKLPFIYAASPYEGLTMRVRQQLNENSKIIAINNVFPEMNHNELVGWREKDDNKVVLFLRNEDDNARVQTRMDISKKLIKKTTPNIIELYSIGKGYWEKIFYFIHVTDWVSVILADLREVDAMEIKSIDLLKNELAKV
ncbi:MAG: bifunctional phosphoglucose/phosphomannose isomerase [Flavipsychrobacter sp.]|nr:bifunctional phosphoglucose/phosphomannose isomerase [Flavipsychrobacter sp.]